MLSFPKSSHCFGQISVHIFHIIETNIACPYYRCTTNDCVTKNMGGSCDFLNKSFKFRSQLPINPPFPCPRFYTAPNPAPNHISTPIIAQRICINPAFQHVSIGRLESKKLVFVAKRALLWTVESQFHCFTSYYCQSG